MFTAPIPLDTSKMAAFLSNNPEEEIPPVEPISNRFDPMASTSTSYSVPAEAEKVFKAGIIANPLISKDLPLDVEKYAALIKFIGNDKPNIPINWRFAESISALKALESIWVNNLLVEKYKVEPKAAVIDTNHASLFFMSVFLCGYLHFPSSTFTTKVVETDSEQGRSIQKAPPQSAPKASPSAPIPNPASMSYSKQRMLSIAFHSKVRRPKLCINHSPRTSTALPMT